MNNQDYKANITLQKITKVGCLRKIDNSITVDSLKGLF